MAIFAVIGQISPDTTKLGPIIHSEFPRDSLLLQEQVWMVAFQGTAQELSDRLGVTDGTNGNAIIVSTGTYYGRANPSIWEFFKQKWESTNG